MKNFFLLSGLGMDKAKKIFKSWKCRYLTVFGKICFIKKHMLPNLTHIATIMPNISKKKGYMTLKRFVVNLLDQISGGH